MKCTSGQLLYCTCIWHFICDHKILRRLMRSSACFFFFLFCFKNTMASGIEGREETESLKMWPCIWFVVLKISGEHCISKSFLRKWLITSFYCSSSEELPFIFLKEYQLFSRLRQFPFTLELLGYSGHTGRRWYERYVTSLMLALMALYSSSFFRPRQIFIKDIVSDWQWSWNRTDWTSNKDKLNSYCGRC